MIRLLLSMLLIGLAWLPAGLLRLLRHRRARRRIAVLDLSARQSSLELAALLEELAAMAQDGVCRGVLLRLGGAPLGWADAGALREALGRARAAGLLVLAHVEGATNADLLVASAADRVWLTPASDVHLVGVGADLVFFGDALERLGVQVDLVAAGAYKSFGEPFGRAWPSAANREATGALVSDLQEQLVAAVAEGRRLSPGAVRALMERAPLGAEEAVEEGLADGLCYDDQVERALDELLGGAAVFTSWRRVAFWRRQQARLDRLGRRRPMVVVVHLEGGVTLREGGGRSRTISAERVVPTLEALGAHGGVGAVVLAINSPGGGALPSDNIARAVQRLAAKKPVVAALGDVAASGGYYIAAPAAEIVAQPGTITGSIGVVGGKLVYGPAVGRYGVHHERVAAGPNGGVYGPWEPFTPPQRERFQASLARTYQRFLMVVAGGRRRPLSSVEPIAQGRVWTGQQALALGLVDRLGGLELAVERAAALASLRGARVGHVDFPPPRLHTLARLVQVRLARGSAGLGTLAGLLDGARLPALPSLLADAPGQPLALLPWMVDGVPEER